MRREKQSIVVLWILLKSCFRGEKSHIIFMSTITPIQEIYEYIPVGFK